MLFNKQKAYAVKVGIWSEIRLNADNVSDSITTIVYTACCWHSFTATETKPGAVLKKVVDSLY